MAADPGTMLVAVGAGLLSFFAPCVLPVIPGYLAFVAGGPEATARRRMVMTTAFVAGFSLAFVLMGLAVGALGQAPTFRSLDTWLQRAGGLLIIVFGLYMTGLLKLPFLDRDIRFQGAAPDALGPVGGATFLGAAFGVGWSPCVGPFLASVLVLAGGQGGVAEAGLLLSLYAAGLAVPFLLLGATADRGAALLKRYGRVAKGVEVTGGVLLILLGIFVFTGSVARFLSYIVPRSPI